MAAAVASPAEAGEGATRIGVRSMPRGWAREQRVLIPGGATVSIDRLRGQRHEKEVTVEDVSIDRVRGQRHEKEVTV